MNITYIDTRGNTTENLTFSDVITKGIADGGGLFVPRDLPQLSLDEIVGSSSLKYSELAALIYKRFAVDLPADTVDALMAEAYGNNFNDAAVAPVVKIDASTHVLELWHGPTAAFKDMALQCLPLYFSNAISQVGKKFLILVATSGDTGKAALEGFKNRANTNVIVFYPHGGVSKVQFKQMATQLGNNVGVFGVKGNFDDCQRAVKETFTDLAFSKKLADTYNLQLSSANSINWGRLLPQIIYYVSSYAHMVKTGAICAGDEIDVCVPTGNFGNILAAYYAKSMGTPIANLLCASNENHVLTDFINTGVYDISNRDFTLTPSPSMDILISSNLERQLFELTGRNSTLINKWMDELREKRCFKVDKQTFATLRRDYIADWISNSESLSTIAQVFEQHKYLLDPHTAVAWKVAERLRSERPVLVVSTAHWAKFAGDVYRALNNIPYDDPIDANLDESALIQSISKQCGGCAVPTSLTELDNLPIRFNDTCESSLSGIQSAILNWVEQHFDTAL